MTVSRRVLHLLLPALLIAGLPACDEANDDDDGGGRESFGRQQGEDDGGDDDGGGVCLNTCEYAYDDECDDGAAGSITSVCEYGSDCGDCGPRYGSDGGSDPAGESDGASGGSYACHYVAHSRTACPGSSDLFSENEGCLEIWATSYTEAQNECNEHTASDTDCYGSCCTRSYSTNVRVEDGAC